MQIKYKRSVGPFILLSFLSFNNLLYSQAKAENDSVPLQFPTKIQVPGNNFYKPENSDIYNPEELIPASASLGNKMPVFYDSLKILASKHLITSKLYNIIIVSGRPRPIKQMRESSDLSYSAHTGKKIRNIYIRRLNIFGSSIENPFSYDPTKIESLLNKTHLNTNELIIRNNLLFSEGDTVSPLILSDNERVLRQLPYIDDSRIIITPVSEEEVDIIVYTRDVYSIGGTFEYKTLEKGSLSIFEKNVLGLGHELRLEVPYDPDLPHSPGFGLKYNINNIARLFINMDLFCFDGLGEKAYGFSINRKLISSETKYAGGISLREMFTTEDLDTMRIAEPLSYNLKDYWFSRSFLLDRETVSRLILSARYTNNNVFDRPFILPDSYNYLQKYKLFLVSAAFSRQKYYRTNLIYGYGRTEDIPYGALFTLTAGKEISEFKQRSYAGLSLSAGHSIKGKGYLYSSAGFSAFLNQNETEQGLLLLRTNYFSNLLYLGTFRIRNFIKADYTRGFGRYQDEYLTINRENGFSGFRNDSIEGTQRLSLSLESVFFSSFSFLGFKYAFFSYADIGFLFGTSQYISEGEVISSIGAGIRLRNDNLVFNTFQIRLGFFPNLPANSKINHLRLSGEQLLKPYNFDPGPPSILVYR